MHNRNDSPRRHCELRAFCGAWQSRKHKPCKKCLDCFVAMLLAMTGQVMTYILQLKSFIRLLLFAAILLLSACTTTTKNDGPPGFNVDATKIPDAVPKAEPRSKYGNLTTYRVFGKRYYVMKSSKNYEENGIASWYGTKFHAQRTSSGERYNMLSMTAAHKTLPLPTYVQVTNLTNGKKVIVKINDRGPFESNRLIDLSYVAAKKIGMAGHGTARVNVKAIDPLEYDKDRHSTNTFFAANTTHHYPSKNKPVYLQIGAFKNKVSANKLKSRIVQMVRTSPIHVTRTASRKKLYRVEIGPIKDVATVTSITKQLNAAGLKSERLIQDQAEV